MADGDDSRAFERQELEQEVVSRFLETLRRTQFLPPDQLASYQYNQLEGLVRHARAHVPFYRDSGRLDPLFRGDGSIDWERWAQIPPLKRKDLQDEFDRLKAEVVPPGQGQIFTLSTSGSSGEPVKVLAPERARRWAWAALRLRDFEWHGIDTAKRLAYLYPFEPGYFDATGVRRYPMWNAAFGSIPAGERVELADTRPAAELVDMVAAIRPAYLHVQPTALQLMVGHDRKHVLSDLRLAAVFSYGEPFPSEAKHHVETHLGCQILELLGTSECGYLAGSCPHCGSLHVHAEVALVEVIADDGAPVRAGETGRTLVTPFYNFVMPLIRYDHDDFAQVGSEGCGITLPALETIYGKQRPQFAFPGGRMIRPTLPTDWVIDCLGAQMYQVAQVAPDRCEFRIVPGSLPPSEMRFDELAARIRAMWWDGLQIDFRIVDALPRRTPRSKIQFIVQEMPGSPAPSGEAI